MNKKIINLNKSGFGLVEVLVATALLGIVTVGVVDLMSNTTKQQKGLQAKDQQRDFTSEIRNILTSSEACKNTFTNLSVPASPTQIKNKSNAVVYSVGDLDKSKLLRITAMKLENFVPSASATVGTAEFRILLSRNLNGVSTLSESIRPDVMILNITKDPVTNNITNCSYIDSMVSVGSSSLWKQSAANSNDIYYDLGNVGVNVANPTSKFHVDGDISLTTPTQMIKTNIIDVADPNSNVKIFENAQSKIFFGAVNSLVVDSSPGPTLGNVGIGTSTPRVKLDIQGEIKLSGSTVGTRTCDSTLEGTQFYDSNKKCMSICDGTKWSCLKIKKPQDCVGAFTPCDSITNKRTYMIVIPADVGGVPCSPQINGFQDSVGCPGGPPYVPPVNCHGTWGTCSATCGGGTQTYTIDTPASNNGTPCLNATGDTQTCNTQNCLSTCYPTMMSPSLSCPSGESIYFFAQAGDWMNPQTTPYSVSGAQSGYSYSSGGSNWNVFVGYQVCMQGPPNNVKTCIGPKPWLTYYTRLTSACTSDAPTQCGP